MNASNLSDELACAQLTIAATYRADAHDIEGFIELFTDDAVIDRLGEKFAGREAILRLLHGRRPERITRHMLAFPSIQRVDQNNARGIAYYTLFEADASEAPNPPYPLHDPTGVGEYHDEYRLTEAGWRITSRRIVPIFRHQKEQA